MSQYKEETTYYPTSEVLTQLIPVTVGCAHKKCAFCAMYESCSYAEVSLSDIDYELQYGNEYTERVFMTGADPLYVGYEKMMKILQLIRKRLPYCACVAAYASVRAVNKYTVEQLHDLHELGLRLLYIGFESGDDEVLEKMGKGHTVEEALKAAKMLNEAQIPFNTIVMYGIAGTGKAVEHAEKTAAMVNQFKSNKIVTMNLTVYDSTPLASMERRGEFVQATNAEKKLEIKTLLEKLDPPVPTVFDTTHSTNYIKLLGTLPHDKDKLIEQLYKEW